MSTAADPEPEPLHRFLSERQRQRPVQLPEDPSDEELVHDYTLSRSDLAQARKCKGPQRKLSFALQLCVVRKYGRFLADFADVPTRIASHLAQQLGFEARIVMAYEREATEIEHRQRIVEHLKLRKFDGEQEERAVGWTLAQPARGVVDRDIYEALEKILREWKILLPAPSTLEELVARTLARRRAQVRDRVTESLPQKLRDGIDKMLAVAEGSRISPLAALKTFPPAAQPDAIRSRLLSIQKLKEMGVQLLDLSALDAAVVRRMAEQALELDAHALRELKPETRYARVACFLVDALKTRLDEVIAMHAQYLTDAWRKSKAEGDEVHKAHAEHVVHGGMELLVDLGEVGHEALSRGQHEIPLAPFLVGQTDEKLRDALGKAVESGRGFLRDRGRYRQDRLRARYGTMRKYSRLFLDTLDFRSTPGGAELMRAIELIREVDRGTRRELPEDVPVDFIPQRVRSFIRDEEGKLDRHIYEMWVMLRLKKMLKSGDIFVPASNDYVSFWNMLMPDERWEKEKKPFLDAHEIPHAADVFIAERGRVLDQLARRVAEDESVVLKDGHFYMPRRRRSTESAAATKLRQVVRSYMKRIRIEDVLIETDRLCNWTRHFVSRSGKPVPPEHRVPLFACIVAHATNLGLAVMAESTEDVTVDLLRYVSDRHLRAETIKAALTELVDFFFLHPLAKVYGEGVHSSSDGQRFGVRGSTLLGNFYPRYFGYYDRALSIYTHVSDQHTVFGTQVISCGPREALYVLDGLLRNDSQLKPLIHTTDTHGYTNQLYGVFAFLRPMRFCPHIKESKKQRLYRLAPEANYGRLNGILQQVVDVRRIRSQWDAMLRVVASLFSREKPAHVILGKLAASSPADELSRAFTDLGHIEKTIDRLDYVSNPPLQLANRLQLNRGEERHKLARRVHFGNQGEFQRGDYEAIMNGSSCLALACNAIAAHNLAVKMGPLITDLRALGHQILDEDIARISPLQREHVIPSGTYRFRL